MRTATELDELDADSAAHLMELASDFVDRARRGECLTVEDFAAENSEFRNAILALFPTILSLEELKHASARPPDGRISLCGHRIERLGEFQILREIGRGGMGVVFEAVQLSLGRVVAVKVFPRRLVSEQDISRFEQEAKIAARLHHTNIVPVYAYGCQDGFCYFAMQRIEGRSLDQLLRRNLIPRFAHYKEFLNWIAEVGIQIASALDYAHQQQVVHRDIKPGNLMIDQQGAAWVTDFGLAHAFSPDRPVMKVYGGTAAFSSPESLSGRSDGRSDIYSLGVTLNTLFEVAGRSEFFQDDRYGRCRRWMPRRQRDPTPPELRAILDKARAPEPCDRYQRAGDLAEDLRRFLGDRSVSAFRESWHRRLWKWQRRNPALAAACSLLCAMALVTITVLSVSHINISRLNVDLARKNERLARTFFAVDALLHSSAPNKESLSRSDLLSLAGLTSAEARSLKADTAAHLLHILPDLTRFEKSIIDDPRSLAMAVNMRRRVGRWLHAAGQLNKAEQTFLYAKEIIPETLSPVDKDRNGAVLSIQQIRLDNDLAAVYDTLLQFPLADSYRYRARKNLDELASDAGPAAVGYDLARTIYGLAQQPKVLEPVRLLQRQIDATDAAPTAFRSMTVGSTEFQLLDRAITLLRQSILDDSERISRPLLLAECLFERAAYAPDEAICPEVDIEEGLRLLHLILEKQPTNWTIHADCIRVLAYYPLSPGASADADVLALEYLQSAVALADEMAESSPSLSDVFGYRALAEFKIGLLLQHTSGPVEAEPYLQRSIDTLKKLKQRLHTDVRFRVWAAVCHTTMALNLQRQDRHDEAEAHYQAALMEFEAIDTEPRLNDAVRQSEQIVRSVQSQLDPSL